MNKIKENIKYLEELSKALNDSISNLKIYFEKISKNKEELKQIVQKIFTKIRNEINNREDELLIDIDNQFNDFFNEEFIKESEKLPNKIKYSLERVKNFEKEWNNNSKLCFFINSCVNIENDIKKIENINEKIKKFKDIKDSKFIFDIEEEKNINKYLEQIKSFGKNINIKKILNPSFIIESSIVKDIIQIKTLKNWIDPNKNLSSKLLYSLSLNGEDMKNAHNLINNKGPTLSIFLLKNGIILGGYTSLNWSDIDGWQKDNNSFIFNLNNKAKYTIKNDQNSIYCSNNYAIYFGHFGYDEHSNYNMKKLCFHRNNGGGNYIEGNKILSEDFTCLEPKEVEVFQIKYV